MIRYKAEMDDHIYLQKVREQAEGGRRSHIRATPTFFINGVVQDISFGMQALHDAVASAVRTALGGRPRLRQRALNLDWARGTLDILRAR